MRLAVGDVIQADRELQIGQEFQCSEIGVDDAPAGIGDADLWDAGAIKPLDRLPRARQRAQPVAPANVAAFDAIEPFGARQRGRKAPRSLIQTSSMWTPRNARGGRSRRPTLNVAEASRSA